MKKFNPETIEAIGYYVYALIDPRKGESDPRRIFYVGKGIRQRCFSHAAAAVNWNRSVEPNPKLDLIVEITKAKKTPPKIELIAHGLTGDEALHLEAAMISVLKTDANLAAGKYGVDYGLSVQEIEGRYSNPLKEEDLGHRVLLVSLNGGNVLAPYPEIRERDMPRRMLKYWTLSGSNADQVEYIIGVYRQLARKVYRVHQSNKGLAVHRRRNFGPKVNGHPNWKRIFYGELSVEKEQEWGNRRILSADGEVLTKFQRQVGCKLIGKHSSLT